MLLYMCNIHGTNLFTEGVGATMTIAPHDLAHVYWIGGSPCSGKSSIAQELAETYGLQLYQADDAYVRHANVVTLERQPIFHKIVHLSPDELWMRAVEEQFIEEV